MFYLILGIVCLIFGLVIGASSVKKGLSLNILIGLIPYSIGIASLNTALYSVNHPFIRQVFRLTKDNLLVCLLGISALIAVYFACVYIKKRVEQAVQA